MTSDSNRGKIASARVQLQNALHYQFRDGELLELALRHGSKLQDSEQPLLSNERLEFLGDSVVGLVISESLYRSFPDSAEGRLAQMKAALVSTEHLAQKARSLDLGECIELGRAQLQIGSRQRNNLLADGLEAVLGAIYLDSDFENARRVILRLFSVELESAHALRRDPKSQLQELTQERFQGLPQYVVVGEQGPPHDRQFTVEVHLQERVLGRGEGRSKRDASQRAADQALQALTGADA